MRVQSAPEAALAAPPVALADASPAGVSPAASEPPCVWLALGLRELDPAVACAEHAAAAAAAASRSATRSATVRQVRRWLQAIGPSWNGL